MREWRLRRLLVTGGRDFGEDDLLVQVRVSEALYALLEVAKRNDITVVHGACPTGVDRIVAECCRDWELPVEPHPAEWERYGHQAGPIRNREMVALGADYCARFPGGSGTAGCAEEARRAGIHVIGFKLA